MKSKNHKRGSKGAAGFVLSENSYVQRRTRRHLLGTVSEPARILAVCNTLPGLLDSQRAFARLGVATRLGRPGDVATALCEGAPIGVVWDS